VTSSGRSRGLPASLTLFFSKYSHIDHAETSGEAKNTFTLWPECRHCSPETTYLSPRRTSSPHRQEGGLWRDQTTTLARILSSDVLQPPTPPRWEIFPHFGRQHRAISARMVIKPPSKKILSLISLCNSYKWLIVEHSRP
jgi:hypothetical protein